MGRRGENIRRRKDGRWEARVVQGAPVCGTTNYKYFYGRSYQEVKKKKKAFLETHSNMRKETAVLPADASLAENLLFRDAAAEWLDTKKSVVRESTFACYTILIKKHLLPRLGELSVDEISSQLLTAFLKEKKVCGRLDGGPLSDKTLSDIKVVLMQILRFAKKQGAIGTVPECPSVASRQPTVNVFTMQEQRLLERETQKESTPFTLGVLLSLYGGLRIGEVCGLQWSDFDPQNGTVTISKTVYRIPAVEGNQDTKTKVIISKPKTDCSLRTIPLPAPIFQYLMERRRAGECYVVTGTSKFMEPRTCMDRYKRFLRRAGVADHTFHALRHTFATRCVENGVDIKSLSEIMGHSDVKITMQRYVHPSMDSKKVQINKLPCFAASGQKSGRSDEKVS